MDRTLSERHGGLTGRMRCIARSHSSFAAPISLIDFTQLETPEQLPSSVLFPLPRAGKSCEGQFRCLTKFTIYASACVACGA